MAPTEVEPVFVIDAELTRLQLVRKALSLLGEIMELIHENRTSENLCREIIIGLEKVKEWAK